MNLTDLELSGLIMYKCEGTKLRKDKRYNNTFCYAIEFTNSDPELIELFTNFLRIILKIDDEKLKCQLFIYEDQEKETIEDFWSNKTGVSKSLFQKSIIFKGKDRFKPSNYGTCKLRYYSKKKFIELNELIISRLGNRLSLIQ